MRNGLTAVAQYTFSKATDNAAAFTTADLNGAVVAQDWLDLDAEHALSSFDQRHLRDGAGRIFGPRASARLDVHEPAHAGSGLPLTPVYLTSIAGTGLTGSLRASYTGASVDDAPEGFYVNPAAFAAPAAGEWGNAARNSITGPAQFSFNAGVTRTFMLSGRWSMDWRLDATNVLNRVTYSSLNTIVGSPQFGLPNRANAMRKLLSSSAGEVLMRRAVSAPCSADRAHLLLLLPVRLQPDLISLHNSRSSALKRASSSKP